MAARTSELSSGGSFEFGQLFAPKSALILDGFYRFCLVFSKNLFNLNELGQLGVLVISPCTRIHQGFFGSRIPTS
jgi:hypothetical protein